MANPNYRRVGIYIEEGQKKRSPIKSRESIPLFIGYTEKAGNFDEYIGQPLLVSGINEFERFFGGGFGQQFEVNDESHAAFAAFELFGKTLYVHPVDAPVFRMYDAFRMYIKNRGGRARIISVGTYEKDGIPLEPDLAHLQHGIECAQSVREPALMLTPDLISLPLPDYYELTRQSLSLAENLQDRLVLIDIPGTHAPLEWRPAVADFRKHSGNQGLSFGAAYLPWLRTHLYDASEMSYDNLPGAIDAIAKYFPDEPGFTNKENPDEDPLWGLKTASGKVIMEALAEAASLQPPSGAMAGVMLRTENMMGIWHAPANTTVSFVTGPSVEIDDAAQAGLNQDPATGKSINAIRKIPSRGKAVVWGNRTLAGNAEPFKFIQVRRMVLFLQTSIGTYLEGFSGEPNQAGTWLTVRQEITEYLEEMRLQGAFAGESAEESYYVGIGMGTTMVQLDLENGIMRVQVGIAPIHPGQFIYLDFEQELQRVL